MNDLSMIARLRRRDINGGESFSNKFPGFKKREKEKVSEGSNERLEIDKFWPMRSGQVLTKDEGTGEKGM